MADVMTPEQRRRCMAQVKSRDTGPEVRLRRALWAAGLRYRLRSGLQGKPDLVFPAARVAVFVDGCYWHSCPIHATRPKTRAAFWQEKLDQNVHRDRRVDAALGALGWRVLRVWEHEVERELDATVARIAVTVRPVAAVAARARIRDLTVQEPDIEDIVRRIYGGEAAGS